MSFIIPLLFGICSTGTFVILFKQKFEHMLSMVFMLSALVIYITGFFNRMDIGYLIALAPAALFPVILILSLIWRKEYKNLFSTLFTPAFLVFLVLYSFVFVLNYNRGFTAWDEISHWGPMVKETLRLDKFFSVDESALAVHKDYPPIISIFEALWCKLCGGYREAYLYRALQTLSFSLLLPALSKLKWSKNLHFIFKLIYIPILMIFSVLIIQVGTTSFYESVYTDCILGLLMTHGIYTAVTIESITKFNILRLCVPSCFLLLTKQMGLVFFLLIIGVFIINYAVIHKKTLLSLLKNKTWRTKIMPVGFTLIVIAIIPYLFYFSWNKYVEINHISRQFETAAIKVSELPGIALGTKGELWQHNALANYLKYILKEPIHNKLQFTYWQFILLSVFIFILLAKHGKNYFKKHQMKALTVMLSLGAVGYACAMLLLYVFNFGSYEGPGLASIFRYLNTYWFAAFLLATMLFLSVESRRESVSFTKLVSISLATMFFFFEPATFKSLIPSIKNNSISYNYTQDTETILSKTPNGSKILIVDQHGNGFNHYLLSYMTLPRKIQMNIFSLGEPYDAADIYSRNLSVEQLKTELRNLDYVYLYHADERFIGGYSDIFDQNANIESKQLYKVNKLPDNQISLKLVY